MHLANYAKNKALKRNLIFYFISCAIVLFLITMDSSAQNRTSGFAEIKGGKVYYEAAGKGKTVIFVHGGLVDSRLWNEQFDEFAKNYRVVRYDIRGHGKSPMPTASYSPVEDLRELLKFLKIEKTTVVGLSLGGIIAADFTLEHPEMVEKLVLVGAGLRGFESKPDEAGWKIFQEAVKAIPEKAAEMWLAHPLLAGVKNNPRAKEKMLRLMTDNHRAYTTINPQNYIYPKQPTIERLGQIKSPTLVVIGDLDHPDLIAISNTLAQKIPNSQIVTMKDASHHPNLEKPEEFNRILRGFLRKKI